MPEIRPVRPSQEGVKRRRKHIFEDSIYAERFGDNLFYQFSTQANVDGCKKPWTTNIKWLQAMWALILLSTTIGTGYLVISVILEYFRYGSTVQYSQEYGTASFPAVTICNTNLIVRPLNDSVSPEIERSIDRLVSIRRRLRPMSGDVPLTLVDLEQDPMIDYFMWNLTDELIVCNYGRAECNVAENFELRRNWLGNCYKFVAPPHVSLVPGSGNGLYLIIDVNYEIVDNRLNFEPRFSAINITDLGLKVAVHAPNEPSLVESRGIPVGPAEHLYLSVQPTVMTELTPPYGKCSEDMGYPLGPGEVATYANCSTFCRNSYVCDQCRCSTYLNDSCNSELCTDDGISCISAAREYLEAHFSELCSKCTVGCLETKYTTTVSYAPINQRLDNGTLSETKLIVVDVFLGDNSQISIVREKAITLETLFANIGGNLGLLMGISVISVCEMVEIVILWLYRHYYTVEETIKKSRSRPKTAANGSSVADGIGGDDDEETEYYETEDGGTQTDNNNGTAMLDEVIMMQPRTDNIEIETEF